ncbi:MAG: hypothetical protein ABR991_11515, partial [Terracidiphilus sp.]
MKPIAIPADMILMLDALRDGLPESSPNSEPRFALQVGSTYFADNKTDKSKNERRLAGLHRSVQVANYPSMAGRVLLGGLWVLFCLSLVFTGPAAIA